MKYPTTYEEAQVFERTAAKLVRKNRANNKKERTAATLKNLEEARAVLPKGWYRHFKGGAYQVLDVQEDVNTGECFVSYVAYYGFYRGVPGLRVLVGKDSFLRPVSRKEYRGVRFKRLPGKPAKMFIAP